MLHLVSFLFLKEQNMAVYFLDHFLGCLKRQIRLCSIYFSQCYIMYILKWIFRCTEHAVDSLSLLGIARVISSCSRCLLFHPSPFPFLPTSPRPLPLFCVFPEYNRLNVSMYFKRISENNRLNVSMYFKRISENNRLNVSMYFKRISERLTNRGGHSATWNVRSFLGNTHHLCS